MKKYKVILSLIVLLLCISYINLLFAKSEVPNSVNTTVTSFVNYLNSGNEQIYTLIDNDNYSLKENVSKYLNNINLSYRIKNIKENKDNSYNVKGTINAKGERWSVSGFSVYFTLVENENERYIIKDTDLFNKVGVDNTLEFIFKIFIIFGGLMLFFILVSIVIIIFIYRKNNNKKAQENMNNIKEKDELFNAKDDNSVIKR